MSSFPETATNNSNFDCHWEDSRGEIISNQNLNLKVYTSIVNIFNTKNADVFVKKSELKISNSENCDISGEENKLELDGELNCNINGVRNNLKLISNRNIDIKTNGCIGTVEKNINFNLHGEKHDVLAAGNSNLTIDGNGGNRLSVKGAINHHITSELPSNERHSEVEVVANRIGFSFGHAFAPVRRFLSETVPQVFGAVPNTSEEGWTANYKIQSNTQVTIDKDNYEVGSFKFTMNQAGPKVHVRINSTLFEAYSLPNNYVGVTAVTLHGVGNQQETIKFSGSKVEGNVVDGVAHFALDLIPNPEN